MFQLVSVASCPSTVHSLEEFGSVLPTPSHETVLDRSEILPKLSESWKKPSSLSFSQYNMCSVLLITLVALCWTHCGMSMSYLVLQSPKLDFRLDQVTENFRGKLAITADSVSCWAADKSYHFFSPRCPSCSLLCIKSHNHAVTSCDSHWCDRSITQT